MRHVNKMYFYPTYDNFLSMIENLPIENLTQYKAEFPKDIGQFEGKKILIVGDVGLDEYVLGEVKRISPEAPVPVLDVNSEDSRVGLSANVAQNIASLGGEPILVGVVGRDLGADRLRKLLRDSGVSDHFLVEDPSRPTTRKLRVMAEHHHIVRVDYEKQKFLSSDIESALLSRTQELVEASDGVIIQDYAKGVLSEKVIQAFITEARRQNKISLVDPHRKTPVSYYRGASFFKPNKDEAYILSGINFEGLREKPNSLELVAAELFEKADCESLVLTRGKEGMLIWTPAAKSSIPTYAKQVFDVTGAGDTVIATLALGLSSGFNLEKSCVLANFAAGTVVAKVGCVPCQLDDLRLAITEHD